MILLAAWVLWLGHEKTIMELYADIDRNLRMQQSLVRLLIAILIGMLLTRLYGAWMERQ